MTPSWVGVIDSSGPPLEQISFEASVTDSTGVNTVLFCYIQDGEWQYAEMMFEPTSEDPNRYVYTIEGPFTYLAMGYYVWSNDTPGYCSRSTSYGFSWGTDMSMWIVQILVVVIVVVSGLVVGLRRLMK
jgi:hypothetical protein